MHIITLDDLDFPALLEALERSKEVGSYERNGTVQVVRANPRLVMISNKSSPEEIAIRPARSINEAEAIARQFLEREIERGSEVRLAGL